MAPWNFGQIAGVLGSIGMAEAAEESVDIAALAVDHGQETRAVVEILDLLRAHGLLVLSEEEPDRPPILTRAGSQYLARKGRVDSDVLRFLPEQVDDLNARAALIDAGTDLVDEFREAILCGQVVEYGRDLAPAAFAEAIDERTALDLFAAAIALIARLSCGSPAGCTAEEIVAVALIEAATDWFERGVDCGVIAAVDLEPGVAALRGVFSLFEDEDVLDLFQMEEPADAALAGNSPIHRHTGVVDQRLDAWFKPFGGVVKIGHLRDGAVSD